MTRPLALALLAALAAPIAAVPSPARAQAPAAAEARAPHPQLVRSVQHRLNRIGFRDVDARTLSTRQIAALHMRLQGPIFGGVGLDNRWINLRSEVRRILLWEAEGRRSY